MAKCYVKLIARILLLLNSKSSRATQVDNHCQLGVICLVILMETNGARTVLIRINESDIEVLPKSLCMKIFAKEIPQTSETIWPHFSRK